MSSDIVSNLEYDKSTESVMQTVFKDQPPPDTREKYGPPWTKGAVSEHTKKKATSSQDMLRNIYEMEEPPEAPDEKGLLAYIKKL